MCVGNAQLHYIPAVRQTIYYNNNIEFGFNPADALHSTCDSIFGLVETLDQVEVEVGSSRTDSHCSAFSVHILQSHSIAPQQATLLVGSNLRPPEAEAENE